MCCLSVRGCNQASCHTPQSAGQGRVSGCWEKSLKTAMDPPSMENFVVKMRMSGVNEIQVLGGETAVWSLSLLLSAGSRNPNLACLTVLFLAMGLQILCSLCLLEPCGSLPAAEAWLWLSRDGHLLKQRWWELALGPCARQCQVIVLSSPSLPAQVCSLRLPKLKTMSWNLSEIVF